MRRTLLAFVLLAACQMTSPDGIPGAGLSDDPISVTSLDAPLAPAQSSAEPTAQVAGPDTVHPKPRPTTDVAATVPEITLAPAADPTVPKSAPQILCERTGGQWVIAGDTGAFICIKPTRDGGKTCRKKGDCEELCLARSGTCAPFAPLFGCNDVFEKDGRRVTLCID